MANLDAIFDDVIDEESLVKPPIAVLKELAQGLEKRTQGLLVGKIEQTVYQDRSFILDFYITAPTLNNYSYQVLKINHDIDFYPLKVTGSEINSSVQANNQKELEDFLKLIISTPEVKKVINGLLAQIKST